MGSQDQIPGQASAGSSSEGNRFPKCERPTTTSAYQFTLAYKVVSPVAEKAEGLNTLDMQNVRTSLQTMQIKEED